MTGDDELYPQYCHHLAPTYRKWCLLRSTDIHGLRSRDDVFERQNVFFHRNLPIHYARIVGVVVAIDDFFGRRIFTIDDGSGACIEAGVQVSKKPAALPDDGNARAYSLAPPALLYKVPECEPLDVGDVVDTMGSLSTFRGEMTMQILRIRTVQSTEEEVALWERRTAYMRDVLERPWVLTERQIRRCRKEAEEDERAGDMKKGREAGGSEVPAAEPGVDGFGRPTGPKPARSLPQADGKAEAGEAADMPLGQSKPSGPELDGFGRAKGQRNARAAQRMERQSRAVEAVPARPGGTRVVQVAETRQEEPKPPKPAFDGFGRPTGHRSAHRTTHAGKQTAASKEGPVMGDACRDSGATDPTRAKERKHSHILSPADPAPPEVKRPRVSDAAEALREKPTSPGPKVDGFGRPVRNELLPSTPPPTRGEARERNGRRQQEPVILVKQGGIEKARRQSPVEVDGFGRPKGRAVAPPQQVSVTKEPGKRNVHMKQAEAAAPRGLVAGVSASGVELDGFGRPKRSKRVT